MKRVDACVFGDTLLWRKTDGGFQEVELLLFRDLDREILFGSRARIGSKYWPERSLRGLLTMMSSNGALSALWDDVSKDLLFDKILLGIRDELSHMPHPTVALPYPVYQRVLQGVEPFGVSPENQGDRHDRSDPGCTKAVLNFEPVSSLAAAVAIAWTKMASKSHAIVVETHDLGVELVLITKRRNNRRIPLRGIQWAFIPRRQLHVVDLPALVSLLLPRVADAARLPERAITIYHVRSSTQYTDILYSLELPIVNVDATSTVAAELAGSELDKLHQKRTDVSVIVNELQKKLTREVTLLRPVSGTVPAGRPGPANEWRKVYSLLGWFQSDATLGLSARLTLAERLDLFLEDFSSDVVELKNTLLAFLSGGWTRRHAVGLVSPFSAGKSTLANALLGTDLLGMDMRAETAVVTRISCGHRPILVMETENDVEILEPDSVDGLKRILREMSGVRARTDQELTDLHVFLPLPEYWRKIQLVDMPGYFSRFDEHDTLADNALEDIDRLLILVDPERIGEEHFFGKILHLYKSGKSLVILLSKRDRYFDDEEMLLDELRIALDGVNVPIVPVSGFFGLWARLWSTGAVDDDDVRRNRDVFVVENDDLVRGRLLERRHADLLEEFSNIRVLERLLMEEGAEAV